MSENPSNEETPSEPPMGQDTWNDIADLSEWADKDPEGFDVYRDEIGEATEREYPDGDGEI